MKKWLKLLMYWVMPGLIVALLLPISGCFTAMANFGRSFGGGPSKTEKAVCVTFDIVTFPVQLLLFGPILMDQYIDENTGERGRRNRELKAYNKAVDHYCHLLCENPENLCTHPDFRCATNKTAMAGARKWYDCAPKNSVDKVRPYGASILYSPALLRQQGSLFYKLDFTIAERRQAYDAVLNLHLKDGDAESLDLVKRLFTPAVLSDAELTALLSESAATHPSLAQAVQGELDYRERKRKEALEREEQKKRWEAEQKEREKRRQASWLAKQREEMRKRQEHTEKIKVLAQTLYQDGSAFQEALALCQDREIQRIWSRFLRNEKKPIPIENLRLLAETVLQPSVKSLEYTPLLFFRPEWESEDLRRCYELMIKRLEAGYYETRHVANLLRHPRTPEDIVRASYTEFYLINLQYTYLAHRGNNCISEEEFNRIMSYKSEINNNENIPVKKRCKLLRKKIRGLMPKKCPPDWLQFI